MCQTMPRNRGGQKRNGLHASKCQALEKVSKQVKEYQKAFRNKFLDHPHALKSLPKSCRTWLSRTTRVGNCPNVSKGCNQILKRYRKHCFFGSCLNMSKRLCVKKYDTVSKTIGLKLVLIYNSE